MWKILSEVTIPGLDNFKLNIPGLGGIFGDGVLFGIGVILQIIFGLVIVIWIFVAVFASIKIVKSNGNADEIKAAFTKFKGIIVAASSVSVLFAALSLAGAFFGFGGVTEWGSSLAQCGGVTGQFYFAQVDMQRVFYAKYDIEIPSNQKAYCCDYNPANAAYVKDDTAPNGFTGYLVYNDMKVPFNSATGVAPDLGFHIAGTQNTSTITISPQYQDEHVGQWFLFPYKQNQPQPDDAGDFSEFGLTDCKLAGK